MSVPCYELHELYLTVGQVQCNWQCHVPWKVAKALYTTDYWYICLYVNIMWIVIMILVWKRYENVSRCFSWRVNTNYEWIVSCSWCQLLKTGWLKPNSKMLHLRCGWLSPIANAITKEICNQYIPILMPISLALIHIRSDIRPIYTSPCRNSPERFLQSYRLQNGGSCVHNKIMNIVCRAWHGSQNLHIFKQLLYFVIH